MTLHTLHFTYLLLFLIQYWLNKLLLTTYLQPFPLTTRTYSIIKTYIKPTMRLRTAVYMYSLTVWTCFSGLYLCISVLHLFRMCAIVSHCSQCYFSRIFSSNLYFILYLIFPYLHFPPLHIWPFFTSIFHTCIFQYLQFQRPRIFTGH